ncbi:DNA helicase RecQ [Rossellomorea vietnamensis]|uniref:DNA helicase RecQ n=1 Tax=Rossellomorea vietnamensis TaxID=218284 RepID=A0A5D4K9T0_9BACI|nr:DNA helicase RecQ [Rossellomorea vietnamensis]TYR74048.1 DNA helicase RecQ [Rossellomorea vietnamensis]
MNIYHAKNYLKEYFGYENFRTGQDEIIQSVLFGQNTAGIMPTGGGKSICYQIPALLLEGITLVVSPLISLMKDQVDALNQTGIPATFINSSLTHAEIERRLSEAELGVYKLVYIAPERLESPYFVQYLRNLPIPLVAVDEAHCISQWGHDFRPSYLKIKDLLKGLPSNPVVLALTATATPQVQNDICASLEIQEENTYITGFSRENLSFKVIKGQDRSQYAMNYVRANKNESGIIYAATRKEVDSLYNKLNKQGFSVGKYHGGMSDVQRNEMQEEFLKDNLQVIVATNAFGMGINKSNVRYVLHHQLPKNMESYYQEAGRAGRDGGESECVVLYSPQDVQIQRFLISQNSQDPARHTQELLKLRQMVDYCHTEGCLQEFILHYFGDERAVPCGKCSNCTDNRQAIDVTKETQMVLSCMIRMGERFGNSLVSQVLAGSKNKKIKEFGFEKLSTYGLMKEQKQKEISLFIDFLISEEYITVVSGTFPVLRVNERGKSVLQGKEKVMRKETMRAEKVSHQEDDELFGILRAIRKELADSEGVPPFVIFSDQTLRDMCRKLPENNTAFLDVKGVGAHKSEKYGSRFLRAISQYKEENAQAEEGKKKTDEPSSLITFKMFTEGLGLAEVAEKRNLSLTTVQNHILQCFEEGMEVDTEAFLSVEERKLIELAVEKTGGEKLKPIKEELPDEISYFQIKVFLHERVMSVK